MSDSEQALQADIAAVVVDLIAIRTRLLARRAGLPSGCVLQVTQLLRVTTELAAVLRLLVGPF
jgi:hypothetical protein